jgi:hypothetical protein
MGSVVAAAEALLSLKLLPVPGPVGLVCREGRAGRRWVGRCGSQRKEYQHVLPGMQADAARTFSRLLETGESRS